MFLSPSKSNEREREREKGDRKKERKRERKVTERKKERKRERDSLYSIDYLEVDGVSLLQEFLLVEEAGDAELILPGHAALLALRLDEAAVVGLHSL